MPHRFWTQGFWTQGLNNLLFKYLHKPRNKNGYHNEVTSEARERRYPNSDIF